MSQLSGQTQQARIESQFLDGPAIMLPAPESQKVFPGRGPQGVICGCGPYPLSTAAETSALPPREVPPAYKLGALDVFPMSKPWLPGCP